MTEEFIEEEVNEEAAAAFEDDDDETGLIADDKASEKIDKEPDKKADKKEDKKAAETDEDPDKKEKTGDGEADKDPDKKKDEKPAGEPTEEELQADIDARAEELEKEAKETAEKEPEKKAAPEEPAAKPRKALPAERLQGLIDSITIDDLPEGKIKVGDDEVDLRKIAEEYPEEFANQKAVAALMIRNVLQELTGSNVLPTGKAVNKIITGLESKINSLSWRLDVTEAHPDAMKIKADPEFAKWVESASESVKALAGSRDSKDSIKVLKLYKTHLAKEDTRKHDEEARKKKEKADGIHEYGLTGKADRDKTVEGDPKATAQQAFDEDDDDDDFL